MAALWTLIFYQPLFNLLVVVYDLVGDMGLAIIVLTILLKFLLYPLAQKSIKSQRALQLIQPKVQELQKRLKDNKDQLARELMQLYQAERVSPLSSCAPLLVQFPFLIALYQIFRTAIVGSGSLHLLYSFVPNPGTLSDMFLGFWHLGAASWPLAVVTGAAQYWQSKMLITTQPPVQTPGAKDESMAAAMNKQMLYMMPALTVILGVTLPSGLILYWLVSILFTIGQQYLAFRHHDPKPAVS